MKREIKFKFWLGHTKKMTYEHSLVDIAHLHWDFTEDIIPLQFTGIKDYADNEIYEGDIISPISSEGYPYLVKFDDGEFCLYSKFGRWGSISKMHPTCDKLNLKINVIGNIYENPGLIEVAN